MPSFKKYVPVNDVIVVEQTTGQSTENVMSQKAVTDKLDTKANTDGFYDEMSVRDAGALRGRGDGVAAEYTYRTTGGSADVADGTATMQSIKGNTLVWNQLINKDNIPATRTVYGITFTNNGDGSITATGTATADAEISMTVQLVNGHKYYLSAQNQMGSASTFNSYIWAAPTAYRNNGQGVIITATATETGTLWFMVKGGTTVNGLKFIPQFIDITRMFGAGNEPSSVAQFRALFPNDYYEYDSGSLLSVNVTGIKTAGFNQFNPDNAEYGKSYEIDGSVMNSTNGYISGLIPCFPDTQYYIGGFLNTVSSMIIYYDPNQNFISRTPGTTRTSILLTTPTNCAYIGVTNYQNPGEPSTPVNYNTLCVNLSWSGYRNGQYEDYWTHTLPIDLSNFGGTVYGGLKSAGNAYDEKTKDKDIRRIGVVDLGDLAWLATGTPNVYYASILGKALGGAYDTTSNISCSSYNMRPCVYSSGLNDGDICSDINTANVMIRDDEHNLRDDTSSLEGIPLFYELATPVETPHNPALNLSYEVSDFGTEEVISDSTTNPQTAPIKTSIVYGLNVVDTIRRLDENYVATGEQTLTVEQKSQVLTNLGITDMTRCVDVPESANAAGTKGNIAVASGYLYICVATNTWQRVAIATW